MVCSAIPKRWLLQTKLAHAIQSTKANQIQLDMEKLNLIDEWLPNVLFFHYFSSSFKRNQQMFHQLLFKFDTESFETI